jgi:hypothetical protein
MPLAGGFLTRGREVCRRSIHVGGGRGVSLEQGVQDRTNPTATIEHALPSDRLAHQRIEQQLRGARRPATAVLTQLAGGFRAIELFFDPAAPTTAHDASLR